MCGGGSVYKMKRTKIEYRNEQLQNNISRHVTSTGRQIQYIDNLFRYSFGEHLFCSSPDGATVGLIGTKIVLW